MGMCKDLLGIALWVCLMAAMVPNIVVSSAIIVADDGEEQEDSSGHWEGVAMAQLEIFHIKKM